MTTSVQPKTVQITKLEKRSVKTNELTDWIDRELRTDADSDLGVNSVLDFRQALGNYDPTNRHSVNQLIRSFFDCRRIGEKQFYLLFFRYQKWLESAFHFEICDSLGRIQTTFVEIPFGFREFSKSVQSARAQVFESTAEELTLEDLRIRIVGRG